MRERCSTKHYVFQDDAAEDRLQQNARSPNPTARTTHDPELCLLTLPHKLRKKPIIYDRPCLR